MIAAARWLAIVVAALAVVDPAIPSHRSARPLVEVIATDAAVGSQVREQLVARGFAVDGSGEPAARVLAGTGDARVSLDKPVWALDASPAAPNVRIVRAAPRPFRVPNQTAEIDVTLEADGVTTGARTELRVTSSGVRLAGETHTWSGPRERWTTTLRYVPAGRSASTVAITAVPVTGETSTTDNTALVRIPPARAPLRTLVFEPAVSWPSVFLRRALEGYPEFDVAALSRATRGFATAAGAPPARLTADALARFEAVLVGTPDALSASEVEALISFARVRGGAVVLVPDKAPVSRYAALLPGITVRARQLAAAVALEGTQPAIRTAEALTAIGLPSVAQSIASLDREPVVFRLPLGNGSVLFGGALDAWRYRAADDDAFGRFWRAAIVGAAAAVPPDISFTVEPAVVRPGERVEVHLRVLPATADNAASVTIDPGPVDVRAINGKGMDEPIRVWPAAEPGVYEGEWRAAGSGAVDVSARAGSPKADATIDVVPEAALVPAVDVDRLTLLAAATGGDVAKHPAQLADALAQRFPAELQAVRSHPMRSPWWAVVFTAGLTIEWAVRRRRGQH